MKQCICNRSKIINGRDAEEYTKKWLEYISDKQGWIQLWRCRECSSYWEMTWEGGNGFDDGVMILRRLSPSILKERWSKQ